MTCALRVASFRDREKNARDPRTSGELAARERAVDRAAWQLVFNDRD